LIYITCDGDKYLLPPKVKSQTHNVNRVNPKLASEEAWMQIRASRLNPSEWAGIATESCFSRMSSAKPNPRQQSINSATPCILRG